MVPSTSGVSQFQRVPIPGTEFLEEEPLYVNAKQYRRILKRRQARAKLEAEGKIPKERPVSRTKTTSFQFIIALNTGFFQTHLLVHISNSWLECTYI